MKKIGRLKYCLVHGFVDFKPSTSKSFKSFYLEDNTFIDIYFKPVDQSIAHEAFVENLLRFSRASQLVHKLFPDTNNIDFESEEAKQVKEKCESAVSMFKVDLKESIKSNENSKIYQLLGDYIDEFYEGSQSNFARSQKTRDGNPVDRKQINQWIKKGFIVADNGLYSLRREID